MEKTVITINMDKTSLREAMTRIIEYITLTPPNPEELGDEELIEHRGMVAHHDTERTFCIIHLASGDHDGRHPERHITITQNNYKQIIEELKDTMAQAAVWYETNIIHPIKY